MNTSRDYFTSHRPWVENADQRTYVVFHVGTLVAVAIHLAIIPLFAWIGAAVLAWFNVVSVTAYGVAVVMNRLGHHRATVAIATVELLVHQLLCIWFLGWESGFQYYLLIIPGLVFRLPRGGVSFKIALSALAALGFVSLRGLALHHDPSIRVDPALLQGMYFSNSLVVFLVLAFFSYYFSRTVAAAEERAQAEHRKVQDLLYNILPASIARRLSDTPEVIAEAFPSASVLFADIVGFTPLSEQIPPDEMVGLLNQIFSDFDDLVDELGLEKIKTIGDAYMVAAGVPEARPDHVDAIAQLALRMRDKLAERRQEGRHDLRMRIGVNTGPVVAGVIGKRKFIYDLWGDAVNTASRMESHGQAGEIQITQATRASLDDRFVVEDRGMIDVKGKGPMRTWWLRGRA